MTSNQSGSRRNIVLLLSIGTIMVIGLRSLRSTPETGMTRAPNMTNGPSAAASVGAVRVKDLQGNVVPLVKPGEPAILMISSVSCGWCKRALKDIGEMSNGRPVPRLMLLTLEGAAKGLPMVEKENVRGAQLVGPAGDNDQVMLTFRYPGTPTFIAIDSNGRVARTMPGYPIREEMKHWLAVMAGDADVP